MHAVSLLGPPLLRRAALVGGGALALLLLLWPRAAGDSGIYRLTLHVPAAPPRTAYLSAWNHGEVLVRYNPRARHALRFTRIADAHDGCTWLAVETLVPITPLVFSYEYEDRIVSCRPDARPFHPSERTGYVVADGFTGNATLTEPSARDVAPNLDPPDDGDCDDDGCGLVRSLDATPDNDDDDGGCLDDDDDDTVGAVGIEAARFAREISMNARRAAMAAAHEAMQQAAFVAARAEARVEREEARMEARRQAAEARHQALEARRQARFERLQLRLENAAR